MFKISVIIYFGKIFKLFTVFLSDFLLFCRTFKLALSKITAYCNTCKFCLNFRRLCTQLIIFPLAAKYILLSQLKLLSQLVCLSPGIFSHQKSAFLH